MRGLCHKCYSSNVNLSIVFGIPMCENCTGDNKNSFEPCTKCHTPLSCNGSKECIIINTQKFRRKK